MSTILLTSKIVAFRGEKNPHAVLESDSLLYHVGRRDKLTVFFENDDDYAVLSWNVNKYVFDKKWMQWT